MPTEQQYTVGKGKPPEHTRFQKGQSGNPAGRRRGSKNVATLLEQVLNERVVVTETGKRKRITKLEAMIKQLANKAASGDHRAIKMLMPLAETCIAPSNAANDAAAPVLLPSAAERRTRALETMKILKKVGYFEHTDGEPQVDHTELGQHVKRGHSSEED
ncbi:MAG: DUF5681 domain-containing protein [Candidatus Binataceae bacterium]